MCYVERLQQTQGKAEGREKSKLELYDPHDHHHDYVIWCVYNLISALCVFASSTIKCSINTSITWRPSINR